VINQLLDILKLIQLELVGLFTFFFIISFFWKNIYKYFSLKAYQSKQRLHQDEVPRIGGLIIYSFLTFTAFFVFHSHLLNIILISAIPIIFIGTKEDIFHNTSPKLRLVSMIITSSLFVYLLPTNLPELDFPFINQVLSFSLLKEIFFIFSILVVINGNNLIDGVNGNMALTNIIQLSVLTFFALAVNDSYISEVYLILIIPLVIFLIFNFPFGKVFSGDTGAYFYGFSISASVIYLFGKYEYLITWNAVLILIYPSIELLFSVVRKKLFENKSSFKADSRHLHSLIFRYLSKKMNTNNNSFTIIFLIPFVFAPLMSCILFDEVIEILFSIFIILVIYLLTYLFFLYKISKK
jgi:UDP-GlcNAc:undecaprenyl-phosphate/decaprenyl-phosphate GlcNAc-1-phosphate transferase